MIAKLIISAVVLGGTYYLVRGGASTMADAFILPITGAVCGLCLAIIWGRDLIHLLMRPLDNLLTGGSRPPDPTPLYSMAEAKRKRGFYDEAVREIRKQLDQFPNDVTGQMLLADIQAENLNDLPGAQLTIERFCLQPGNSPKNVADALCRLADWHLKLSHDVAAARQALEKIAELLPESEESLMAAQRIAHLSGTAAALVARERPTLHLEAGKVNLGLLKGQAAQTGPVDDPAARTVACVAHLEQHPLDSAAREELALLYANHHQRLDLATDQLEQLIQQPHQPARQVVHWLHTLADLQVKHTGDYDLARQTLERVIDLYPDGAAAGIARTRIAHLKLELRGQTKSQQLKIGTYEHLFGPKRRPTRPP